MTKRLYSESVSEEDSDDQINSSIESSQDENSENQVGNIKSIRLYNFMCHDNFHLVFGPKINFIIGNNGSGKSAILTGIMICLGAKASNTSRGSSLRSLIKEGETAASIILVLGNSGPEAYKPEIYGNSIIVERKLFRDAPCSFKIKSSCNKTISVKKEELTSICDHMKIQPDNPISILSQEVAKKFIGSTSPDDKYKFFLRATHLSQLLDDLNIIQDTSKVVKKVIDGKKLVLPELQNQFTESQTKYKQLGEAQSQHEKIQDLKNEMAWAQVVAVENELEKQQTKKEIIVQKMSSLESHVKNFDADLSKMKSMILEQENRKEAQLRQEASFKEKIKEIKDQKAQISQKLTDSKRTQEKMNKDITKEKKCLATIEARLEQENQKLEVDLSSKKERILAKITCLTQEIATLNETIQEKDKETAQEEHKYNETVNKLRELENESNQINSKIQTARRQLRDIEHTKKNHLSAYGPSMPDILRDIQKEKRWETPPVGPLGLYVELSDKKWGSVIEQLLDSLLNSFMVTNYDDQRLLNKILASHRCFSRIYVSNLDRFDFRAGEPDKQFQTILRLLKFKNEQVMRQLIVTAKIEKTILVEKRSDGDTIMHRPPRNVLNCYSIDGFQIGIRGGGFGTFALAIYNKVPRLSQVSESRSKEIESEIQRLELEQNEIKTEQKKIDQNSREVDQRKRTIKASILKINTDIRNKQAEIRDLKQEIEDLEPANIVALEEKKLEHENNIQQIAVQFRNESSHVVINNQKLLEYEQAFSEISDMISSINSELELIQKQIDDITEKLEKEEGTLSANQGKLHRGRQVIQDLDSQIQVISSKLQTVTSQAQAYCSERVKVTKSMEVLAREIQCAETALEEVQQSLGQSLEQCRDELILRGQAFKKARVEIKETEVFVKDLDDALETRIDRWQSFLRSMSKRTRMNFQYNLAKRGFKGKLEFNHPDQKLYPLVQVNDQTQTASKERDPKSLSGGEKSFSTICLLLALWESMECPIRCLDEYDVFMDAANRKISTKMIIESARRTHGVQYILITPQSMDDVDMGEDVKISRLTDPRKKVP